MGYKMIENQLDYNSYVSLRESVGWINFSKEQTEKALSNSFYSVIVQDDGQNIGMGRVIDDGMCSGSRVSIQLIAEVGKEDFYIKQGFKLIPHEYCGPALRKIIHK